ncbi:MAG TPA: DUF397 domain-containing protein [Streptomyces sp.]|nr:DUF397 domain-containing protein [Streptomyces sp.]
MNTERSADQSSGLAWFKSSYSGTSGGDCVEVAAAPAGVLVRDSKERHGPVLSFSAAQWSAFVAHTGARTGAEG